MSTRPLCISPLILPRLSLPLHVDDSISRRETEVDALEAPVSANATLHQLVGSGDERQNIGGHGGHGVLSDTRRD
jgi:hypothetical protein